MSGLSDIANGKRDQKVKEAMIKAGACLTDDEIDLVAGALTNGRADNTARDWKSLLPSEEGRAGIALPYMVSESVEGWARVGTTVVGTLLAFVRDNASAKEIDDWAGRSHSRGEYFTAEDEGASSLFLALQTVENIFIAAGGAAKLWYMLGLTPRDIKTDSVLLLQRVRQRDTSTAGARLAATKNPGRSRDEADFEAQMSSELEDAQ